VDFTIGSRVPTTWPAIAGVNYEVDSLLDRGDIDPASGKRLRKIGGTVPVSLTTTDIYHSHYFVRCPVREPVVIQHVHDMLPERMPEIMGWWGKREVERKRVAIFAADGLICLSSATRDELQRVYPTLQTPMYVVHLAGEHLAVATEPGPVEPYVLFVGHRHIYKNFHCVLRAMRAGDWPKDLELHVVGRPPNVIEKLLIHRYRLARRVRWLGSVGDAELAMKYARAAAFVFPSLMEGFGIPVLEAQRNGCPLVASDIPVFREVAGDGAEFFDPRDPESLAAAVARTVAKRSDVIQRGFFNTSRFSWRKTADETVKIYHQMLQVKRLDVTGASARS